MRYTYDCKVQLSSFSSSNAQNHLLVYILINNEKENIKLHYLHTLSFIFLVLSLTVHHNIFWLLNYLRYFVTLQYIFPVSFHIHWYISSNHRISWFSINISLITDIFVVINGSMKGFLHVYKRNLFCIKIPLIQQ